MKGPEFDIEKIEAYLLNRLGPDEKVAFEKAMNQDYMLAQEVTVQQETIKAIHQFRKAELKARLNTIEINNGMWSHTGKIAAAILLLFSLGTATYLIMPADSSSEEIKQEESNILDHTSDTGETAIEFEEIPVTEALPSSNAPIVNPVNAPLESKSLDKTVPSVKQPVAVSVPELNDSFDFGEDLDKQIALPNPDIAKIIDTKEKLNVDLIDQEGVISYKYYNNKLFLYGRFNAEPYEVLELNTTAGKEVFLYFKGNFYKLNPDTFDVSSLDSISDPELKQQLEKFRAK